MFPSAEEFINLPIEQAERLAAELNLTLRNYSEGSAFVDDLRSDRVNVWCDASGIVVRAEKS